MKRFGVQGIAVGLGLWVGASLAGVPANPVSRQLSARQQLNACMTKQMSASRTISYIQAESVCKIRIQSQSAILASSAAVKPGDGQAR